MITSPVSYVRLVLEDRCSVHVAVGCPRRFPTGRLCTSAEWFMNGGRIAIKWGIKLYPHDTSISWIFCTFFQRKKRYGQQFSWQAMAASAPVSWLSLEAPLTLLKEVDALPHADVTSFVKVIYRQYVHVFRKIMLTPPKKSCRETWVRCWSRCLLVSDFWIFFLIGTFPKLVFSTKQVFLWLECHIQMWQHSRQFSSSPCGSHSVIVCTKLRRCESWPLTVTGNRGSAILVGRGSRHQILFSLAKY